MGCFFCDQGLCVDPTHEVVKTVTFPSLTSGRSLTPQGSCVFCGLGICQDTSHQPLSSSQDSDSPVPIWDVRNSSGRALAPPLSFRPVTQQAPRFERASPPREPPILINGVDLEVALTTRLHPSPDEEAQIMSRMIGADIGTRKRHAIPKIIHRFWTGGSIRKAALTGLIEDGDLATQHGWRSYLWYSETIEGLLEKKLGLDTQVRDSQRIALRMAGYTVCSLEEVREIGLRTQLHHFGTSAGMTCAQGGGWDEIKYFSDFARLAYLFAFGGIHIDIDMRLGDIDLSKTYYHNDVNGQIPLLGTLARDSRDVEVGKHLRVLKSLKGQLRVPWLKYEDSVRFLVERAVTGAGMFNALIASRPGTGHLALALNKYCEQSDVISGMALQKYLLLGQAAVHGSRGFQQAAVLTVPPYLLRLDQLTAESDL
ncbi:hypothetical protein [Corallococcus aberystwythensis]|uniref:Uncharacterized protein n=1 Tax=Corallococcus aberystwythensis TaxID=2316722 RepID=A0A3A8PYR2_9BACT|nr:hypothetical protein [Corallococcus aberystwythensis]RKH56424.1 hypothetical protein D7W81_33925 [Corallococcus aberystwythensis]